MSVSLQKHLQAFDERIPGTYNISDTVTAQPAPGHSEFIIIITEK